MFFVRNGVLRIICVKIKAARSGTDGTTDSRNTECSLKNIHSNG